MGSVENKFKHMKYAQICPLEHIFVVFYETLFCACVCVCACLSAY